MQYGCNLEDAGQDLGRLCGQNLVVLLTDSLDKHLLSPYNVTGPMLGTGVQWCANPDTVPALWGFAVQRRSKTLKRR